MPKRDEAFMRQQRGRILDAALQCLQRKGLRATSIRDICKEVGLSVGAVYIHFENRDAIVEAVCRRVTEQTSGSAIVGSTAMEFIDNLTDIIIECHKNPSMSDLNHQLIADALSTKQMAELYAELMGISFDFMKKQLTRLRDSGEIEMPFDLDTTAVGLSSFLTGYGLRMYFEKPRPERTVKRELQDLIGRMIGVPEVTSQHRSRLQQAG